jgi:hypothetical protein
MLLACGGAHRPVSVVRIPPPSLETREAAPEERSDPSVVTVSGDLEKTTPSTATYEQAISTPEPIDVNDDRAHLTDAQLTSPMRGVVNGCRVPSNARVTIKTAVQYGRAIGVTVNVRFDHGRSRRPLPMTMVRSEAKLSAKIASCVDHAVRVQTWPPSRRRDSFVTAF